MSNRKSTMVELVDELKKLPKSTDINFMIQEALAGEYHDYKNEKYVCGKMESSQRLRTLGYPDLAQRIENGEFDETCDDDDKERLAKELTENMPPEQAQSLINALGLNE